MLASMDVKGLGRAMPSGTRHMTLAVRGVLYGALTRSAGELEAACLDALQDVAQRYGLAAAVELRPVAPVEMLRSESAGPPRAGADVSIGVPQAAMAEALAQEGPAALADRR